MDKRKNIEGQPEIKKEDLEERQRPEPEKDIEPDAPDLGEEQAP